VVHGDLRSRLGGVLGDPPHSAEAAARAYKTWIHDGRLSGLPAKRSRRLPLLDLVAQDFEPGRTYSADEVKTALERWFPDTTTLGRYLVDEGFMDRLPDGSHWWRSGGTVDLHTR
jgi:hypothetical protein